MLNPDIEALGAPAFAATVKPLNKLPQQTADILGWDTEYDSKTGAFICFQLWGANGGRLFTEKMTVDSLAKAARILGVKGRTVYLVSYFSIAEMQFLPVIEESKDWRLFGGGSLDVAFYSKRYCLELQTFDIARFFDKSSLKRVAESFGRTKLEFDTTRVSKASLKSAKFREYALHDAWLTYEILGDLRQSLGGPDPLTHRTAPGCAAALFRREYLGAELLPPETPIRRLIMEGCWGGRAEAFRRGVFPLICEYDLKSAYPQAAVDIGDFPLAESWREYARLPKRDQVRAGFASVRFEFPGHTLYPCLPVVTDGVQLYPLMGETTCTLEEIWLAQELGARITLLECAAYSKGSRDLARYMADIMGERDTAKGARKVALKLLANSLIGKLAQRVVGIDIEKLRQLAEDSGVDIRKLARLTPSELAAIGVLSEARIGAIFYPEWQGLITGRVRARISALSARYGSIYTATDAIWVVRPIRGKLPPDLSLKRQGPGIVARTRLGLIGEGTETHLAHHGIFSRKVAEDLLRLDLDGVVRYTTKRPTKLKEALKSGNPYGIWREFTRYGSAKWDGKRRLCPGGSSQAWPTAGEYQQAQA